jgi:hypothetical protein
LFICHLSNSSAQLFDNFSDGDFTNNPSWNGDVENFIVNEDQVLQLDAAAEGSSQLFTNLIFPDSISWHLEFMMDFSPSSSNRLRVYLALDNNDISIANGYYFEIGESGSEDPLDFYFLNNGESEWLGSLTTASIQQIPVDITIDVNYFPDGLWEIYINKGDFSPFYTEMFFNHSDFEFNNASIFNLECNYTASRKDKFFFDNISIVEFQPDVTGPVVTNVEVIDPRTLRIVADEALEPGSALNKENYSLSENSYQGSIESVALENEKTVIVNLSIPLEGGVIYQFTVLGLLDEKLNKGGDVFFDVFIVSEATSGDLVINEILFNPETGGYDYVEIYNKASKFIDLSALSINNSIRDESKIVEAYLIKPNEYLCLTENIDAQKTAFDTPDEALFLETDLPGYNNDTGNVSLIHNLTNSIIDAFNYSEDIHSVLLDDLNGVSLEKIDLNGSSDNRNNWSSAAGAFNYGTPGYQNSVLLSPGFGFVDVLDFESKTFSPNQDGMDDQLVIKYKFPNGNYLTDIKIFDQGGRLIKNLVNNELFSSEGFVLWDGINDLGELSSIGIYFVVLEAFNERGNVLNSRKAVILADYLD